MMWKEVVPPSTMWRSMSVRTDIVWTETIGTVKLYKRYSGTGLALRASPSKRSQCNSVCASTRLHDFVFCVRSDTRIILCFSRSRRSRSRYYNIILLFAAASLIQIIMHRPPAAIIIILLYIAF